MLGGGHPGQADDGFLLQIVLGRGADMATQPGETRPTIVLVHGAWADASGFAAEIRVLRERGFRAIGFANPLRGLADDATYLTDFLRGLAGPIVLVGHSYGGAVISAAAAGNEQVKALVFFDGWMPDEGESITQVFERMSEGSLVPPAIRPVPFTRPDGTDDQDLYLDIESFQAAFCADVDPGTAEIMAATQRPWSAAAFGEPSGPPAWKTLPCWYLLGAEDRAIPPALQRFMAERAKARIQEVPASHASMVSQPEAATELILRAAEAAAPAMA
jgi:pimeloyl-ACP methyl ester carboxylesterase